MLVFMLLRLFYGIIIVTTGVMVLTSFSRFVFGRSDFKQLAKNLLFSTIWPLALFTSKGRSRVLKMLPFKFN